MDKMRRKTLAAIGVGFAAGLTLALAKKGITGPAKLMARMPRPNDQKANTFGYNEVKTS